jgi:hypothetical protein
VRIHNAQRKNKNYEKLFKICTRSLFTRFNYRNYRITLKTRIMSLTEKLIGYQLKANEYTRLIDQSKRNNQQILVDVYTDLLNQCNVLINLCNNNL